MVTTKTIIQRALEMISDIKGGDSIKTALNIVKNLGAKVAYGNIKEARRLTLVELNVIQNK